MGKQTRNCQLVGRCLQSSLTSSELESYKQTARQEWSEDQVLRPICGLRPAVIASLVWLLFWSVLWSEASGSGFDHKRWSVLWFSVGPQSNLWSEASGFRPQKVLRPPLS